MLLTNAHATYTNHRRKIRKKNKRKKENQSDTTTDFSVTLKYNLYSYLHRTVPIFPSFESSWVSFDASGQLRVCSSIKAAMHTKWTATTDGTAVLISKMEQQWVCKKTRNDGRWTDRRWAKSATRDHVKTTIRKRIRKTADKADENKKVTEKKKHLASNYKYERGFLKVPEGCSNTAPERIRPNNRIP